MRQLLRYRVITVAIVDLEDRLNNNVDSGYTIVEMFWTGAAVVIVAKRLENV